MIGYGNSMFLATHGILARSASGGAVDPDAQAFITAASITDPTQQSAINQLVVDLKGYNIWTKFKAIYPFCGSTASQQKWNLKDPRDLDAAFRLVFNGGWTHSANGALPNGTNAYADTKLNLSTQTTLNDIHLSFYSRNNSAVNSVDIGVSTDNVTNYYLMQLTGSTTFYIINESAYQTYPNFADTDTRGLYLGTRNGTVVKGWKNGTLRATKSPATTAARPNFNVYLGCYNQGSAPALYSARQQAFASIGSGLTDTEAANFYTAVQAFQTTLGRSIGTQTVSDADAQAFVTNAGIVDQVEANAVNNLVIGLKADGLWTKMKAVYPFVGGTSTSTTYNLRNTAQYQISWNGGWTWNSQGVTGNASNSFANTGFNPNSAFSTNDSAHLSLYSRTNSAASAYVDFGATNGAGSSTALNSAYTNSALSLLHNGSTGISTSNTNTQGFYVGTRTTSAIHKLFKGGVQIGSTDTTSAGTRTNLNLYLGAYNVNNSALYHTNRNYAFASIGDGLTDADVTNLNTRVTTFQTALNRNV